MQQPFRVPPSAPARLVVLASGTGSLLASLLDAAVGDYPARVVAVGLDRDCPAADIAANASKPHAGIIGTGIGMLSIAGISDARNSSKGTC